VTISIPLFEIYKLPLLDISSNNVSTAGTAETISSIITVEVAIFENDVSLIGLFDVKFV
jgi:hypothetical protein